MREKFELLTHFIVTLIKLLKPGGFKALVAENQAMRQQLLVMSRSKKRSPSLTTFDRFFFGFMSILIGEKRLPKIAVILKPETLLNFHKALVNKKYSTLFSNKTKNKPGRKARDQKLIDLAVEMKIKNPMFGYGRIAMQIQEAFGIAISRFAVARILRKNRYKLPSGKGPSWLTFIGHLKDSLWSVDLFRCESINLKSHWVMVVMDQFTRRIIRFAVHAGDCDGVAYCRMFNEIISGKTLPSYLSSDNDPLFMFHRWKANLRIIDVEEIKSVPGIPESHPFIERLIGSSRREFLDHVFFFNSRDLKRKLDQFQHYYNESRAHSSLHFQTPSAKYNETVQTSDNVISLDNYRWKSAAGGLIQLPVAA